MQTISPEAEKQGKKMAEIIFVAWLYVDINAWYGYWTEFCVCVAGAKKIKKNKTLTDRIHGTWMTLIVCQLFRKY